MGINVGQWMGNAVKTAGKPFDMAGHAFQTAEGAVTGEVGKIPLVGRPLSAVIDLSVFMAFPAVVIGSRVVQGGRIDQVLLSQFKQELQNVKAVAPYAQMVVSFVPGIGPGVSGAIGAGLALADGQPISKAMLAAVKGSLPGGPLAGALFDMAQSTITAAASHKPFTWETVAAAGVSAGSTLAGLPEAAKGALLGALDSVNKLAHGIPADVAIADGAIDSLGSVGVSPDAQKALQIGMATAHAVGGSSHGQTENQAGACVHANTQSPHDNWPADAGHGPCHPSRTQSASNWSLERQSTRV